MLLPLHAGASASAALNHLLYQSLHKISSAAMQHKLLAAESSSYTVRLQKQCVYMHCAVVVAPFCNAGKVHTKATSIFQEPHSEMEPESRLGSQLTGFKNCLKKPSTTAAARPLQGPQDPYLLSQAAGSRSTTTGPSPSPLDSGYDFSSLAGDRQEAAQGTAACLLIQQVHAYANLHRCHLI